MIDTDSWCGLIRAMKSIVSRIVACVSFGCPRMNLHQTRSPCCLRQRDRVLDLLERDPLLDRAQHVGVAGLDAELEQLEVRRLQQADELVVDAVDARLRGEADATVEAALEDPGQDRLRPPHVEAERLVLDPDPAWAGSARGSRSISSSTFAGVR